MDPRLAALQDRAYQDPLTAGELVHTAIAEGWLDSVQGHVILAKALYQRNEFQASMGELAAAEPLASVESQPLLYAQIRSLAAQNYYRMGSMDQAMIAARESLRALDEAADPRLSAQLYNIIGAVHLASGERENALENFERSLRGFEALGARPEIAKLHNNLGVLYIENRQLDLAEPHLETSLTVARELGRTTTIIANLVNLSELHARRGESAAARKSVDDCFATVQASEDESSLVWCHEAASFQLREIGELASAVAQSRKALGYAERFGLQQNVVDSARALASMLSEMGLHEDAAAMNDRAFVTMDAIRDQLLKLRLQQSNAVIDYERAKSEVRALRLQDDYQKGRQKLLFIGLAVLIPMLLVSLWLLRSRGMAVRAMAELSARNETLALTDSLTGLPNRRAFLKDFSEQSIRRQADVEYCLLMIDIDHFKAINDRFGHDSGDEVLQRVARVLNECLRSEDRAARWGGEEFVVFLHRTDVGQALTFADRLQSQLRVSTNAVEPQVTVSVGIACSQGRAMTVVLGAADAAMYDAKRNGRNQVRTEADLRPVASTP